MSSKGRMFHAVYAPKFYRFAPLVPFHDAIICTCVCTAACVYACQNEGIDADKGGWTRDGSVRGDPLGVVGWVR